MSLPPAPSPSVLVEAPARLDQATAGPYGSFLQALVEAGAHRLILDLAALEYLGSAGVRSLVVAQQAVQARGGKLALLSVRPAVREVLRICGLESRLPLAESVEAARRWVA
jgi:anti-anti-sigma factor